MNRLSHSSATCFQDCPKKWELRYRKKVYPKKTSAALLFGSALDSAVEELLNTRSLDKAKEELIKAWNTGLINKKPIKLSKSVQIVYANSDFDYELISEEDVELLKKEFEWDNPKEELAKIYKQKDILGFERLSKDVKVKLNYSNWLSLKSKGMLMLETFERRVLPNITEVLGTQLKIELSNDKGDSIIGYTDFVVKWKDIEEPVILDLKTSSRLYEDDAVLNSPQLALYTHVLSKEFKTRKAGFVVLHKRIKKNKTKICSECGNNGTGKRFKTCDAEIDGKRCNASWIEKIKPEATFQVLMDDIPQLYTSMILENMQMINLSINNNIFQRNFKHCEEYFGCDYKDICYKNDYSNFECPKEE